MLRLKDSLPYKYIEGGEPYILNRSLNNRL
jgi:hypothetical protein